MSSNYIYAPYKPQPITYHKGKVKRVKRAKTEDIPVAYRKKKWKLLNALLDEIRWQIHLMKIGGKANV